MIYLGIGSNMGDKLAVLQEAVRRMEDHGIRVLAKAPIFQTPAWGGVAEGDFLNSVLEVDFAGTAPELLDLLLQTESDIGRERILKWGNRLIDLDILEFHREVWQHPRLVLPHPGYMSRPFVLAPFAAFRPEFIPTGQTQTVAGLLSSCDLSDIHRMEIEGWS